MGLKSSLNQGLELGWKIGEFAESAIQSCRTEIAVAVARASPHANFQTKVEATTMYAQIAVIVEPAVCASSWATKLASLLKNGMLKTSYANASLA